ncbi:Calsenilin, partial [Nibea albiflora]
QADGKVVDGSLLGDANGVEPAPGRVKDSGKWQKPRFSRKALMKCCLVKWIIASTQPQDKGERRGETNRECDGDVVNDQQV